MNEQTSGIIRIGKGSEFVTESAPFRIKDGACQGRNFEKIIIEVGITGIGAEAFKDCLCLTSVTLPDTIIEIGQNAFENCKKLSFVNLPESVLKIGEYAFHKCVSLVSVSIPPKMTSVENGVFYFCSNLEYVILPEGITSIGEKAFSACYSLERVTLPKSLKTIGKEAFSSSGLKTIVFPNSVTKVGEYAFEDAKFESIVFSENMIEFDSLAFVYCDDIVSVTIPSCLAQYKDYFRSLVSPDLTPTLLISYESSEIKIQDSDILDEFTPNKLAEIMSYSWIHCYTDELRRVLADDFEYTSQWVFDTMHGAEIYLDYLSQKFKRMSQAGRPEVTETRYDEHYIEIDLAQNINGESFNAMLSLEIKDGKIIKGCMCHPEFRRVGSDTIGFVFHSDSPRHHNSKNK